MRGSVGMADQNLEDRVVIVVDSDVGDLTLMSRALRGDGYKALPAISYLSGINTFRLHRGRVHLLVTAVALPEKNGCELAKDLMAADPDLKVLFVSAAAGAETCRYYGMLGEGVYFLEKPVQVDDFVKLVRLILEPAMPARAGGAT
jgi:DNA-binding NtrC family response regulator